MKWITSRTNEQIKKLVKLHSAGARAETGLFIAEGKRTIQTLIQSGITCLQLFVIESESSVAASLLSSDLITLVSSEIIDKIATTNSPSGVVGLFKVPAYENPPAVKNGVILCELQDPGNLGTIIRSAAAFGWKTVFCVGGTDPWSPKSVHASVGTIGFVRIVQCSWQELLAWKQDTDLTALVCTGGMPLESARLQPDTALVIGSEAHGIRPEWENQCDKRITISMPGGTESLNAAAAASIALHHCSNLINNRLNIP